MTARLVEERLDLGPLERDRRALGVVLVVHAGVRGGLDEAVAVAVQRLGFGQPEPWLLERLAELNGENTEPFAARTFGNTVNSPVAAGP